ncbi:MAG: glycosyltransferase family 8 protein [Prolixibacteraceae bacterium]|nr:glycosyltransferase family 8 protein [Prolixibacteraceae bacterium]
MEKDSSIAIIVACDDHYVVLLAALLKSIEYHHKTSENIVVFIVEDGISSKNQKKLTASLNAEKIQLIWISMDEAIPEDMHIPFDRSSYPKNIHTRIFIPHFIPERFDKIIYLDVDMILMRDISDLWNVDLGENMLAAVMDPRLQVFSNSWGGILNYKELGFAPDTKYFNTGILVINNKKWREENSASTVVKCIADNEKFANYPDQYGINIVMANRWVVLDPRWNWFADTACEDPFLIHFVGRKPMYQTYDNREEFKKIFFEHLNRTKWNNFKPIGESKRYIKKISNILKKIPDFLRQKS